MISLFIDTSSSRLILGLIKDNKLIDKCEKELNHDLSAQALPYLDRLLKNNNLTPKLVDKIFVVNGPGSFTGIRIGVTIAKMIAWALNKEIVTISELELIASTPCNSDYIIPYIDARRNAVYAGIYDKNGNNVMEDCYISIDCLKDKLDENKSYTFVSYDFDKLNISDSDIKPHINIENVVGKHINDNPMNPHSVNPNYLKRTEAEENLDKK